MQIDRGSRPKGRDLGGYPVASKRSHPRLVKLPRAIRAFRSSPRVGEGKLHPHIDRVIPLEQATDAMAAIADRSVQGRIVLRVR